METLLQPRTPGERVFASCYRADRVRWFLIHGVIPAAAVSAMVVLPLLAWRIYGSVAQGLPEALHNRAVMLTGAIALVGVSAGLMLLLLFWSLRRSFYTTVIRLNDRGLALQQGRHDRAYAWQELKAVRVTDMGRLQSARVDFTRGRVQFDATMIDANGPVPRLRRKWTGEYLEYPDGRMQRLRILDNELYKLLAERAHRQGVPVT